MSVWKSDETLLSICILNFSFKNEVRQKYSAARRIFNSLFGVSSGDETLHLMFDVLLKACGFLTLYISHLYHHVPYVCRPPLVS